MAKRETIISLPIEERQRAHDFYSTALGLEAVGDLGSDGLPEPLQFKLGRGVNLMFIPTKGFAWVLGEDAASADEPRECLLNLSVDSDQEVEEVVASAEAAGATVKRRPEKKSWGYTGTFADPDGHVWAVTNPIAW